MSRKSTVSVVLLLFSLFFVLCRSSLLAGGPSKPSYIPPSKSFSISSSVPVFQVTDYDLLPPEGITAFDAALDLWALEISVTVPITVQVIWTPLSANYLALESTTLSSDFPSAPKSNVLYPKALAKQYAGFDISATLPDVYVILNSDLTWYFGTDGKLNSTQYDFVTVVMHEIAHGLGFIGGPSINPSGLGSIRTSGEPIIYSFFVINEFGQRILDIPDPSLALAAQLKGATNLYLAGKYLIAKGLGPAKLWTPSVFSEPISYSHFDEFLYPQEDLNSLMTPSINAGEAIHDIGDLLRGVLQDIGWGVKAVDPDPVLYSDCKACCRSQILPGYEQCAICCKCGQTALCSRSPLETFCGCVDI
eukprot:TRINITY_DN4262_c0_g1_i1.p1 TRINITY_DN4262_c0_g1~~TRINITY_DN4262_c0_g1_i1.p1  ORF type:complete len:382 (-),score=46.11 TRINITY_DN4262_c0_g1_i1:130-1215(-)